MLIHPRIGISYGFPMEFRASLCPRNVEVCPSPKWWFHRMQLLSKVAHISHKLSLLILVNSPENMVNTTLHVSNLIIIIIIIIMIRYYYTYISIILLQQSSWKKYLMINSSCCNIPWNIYISHFVVFFFSTDLCTLASVASLPEIPGSSKHGPFETQLRPGWMSQMVHLRHTHMNMYIYRGWYIYI